MRSRIQSKIWLLETLFSFLSEASAGVFHFSVFFFHSSWMKLSFLSVQSHKPVTSWSRDLQHLRPTSPELRPKWRSSRWEHRLNRFSAMTTWGHQRVVSPCWRLSGFCLSSLSLTDRLFISGGLKIFFKLVLKSLDGAQRRDFRSVFSWTDLSAA